MDCGAGQAKEASVTLTQLPVETGPKQVFREVLQVTDLVTHEPLKQNQQQC